MDWILNNHISELASILGLAVALGGFWLTLHWVWRSKTAAEAAETAAKSARDTAIRSMATVDLSAVLATMEEIKQHHRAGSWAVLPIKYQALRRMLIGVRSHPNLSASDQDTIKRTIRRFASFETTLDKTEHGSGDQPDVPRLNELVSGQIDGLTEILERLKHETGG